MIKIEKLQKKYNINVIKETHVSDTIMVSEFSGIDAINNSQEKEFGLIIKDSEVINKDQLEKISLIIISDKKELDDKTKKRFISYGKPTLYSKFSKRELISLLEAYLLKKQQTPERIHATMLSMFGEGVIITGKSGIGKSELALSLINKNHLFIGDDAIDVICLAGQPIGKAPYISRDFIEVRGVGIINVRDMFGIQSVVKQHNIDLAIELVSLDDVKTSIERLGREYSTKTIVGTEIPLIQVPVSSGRDIAHVVEAAIIAHKQRKYNKYVAVEDLNERIKKG